MRVKIYLLWAALAVTSVLCAEDNQDFFDFESVDAPVDPETLKYLLPNLIAKYRPKTEWGRTTDPRFYLLNQLESSAIENQEDKPKRIRNKRYNYSPTLSVQAPIQALRNLYDRSNYQQRIFQNRQLIKQLSSS